MHGDDCSPCGGHFDQAQKEGFRGSAPVATKRDLDLAKLWILIWWSQAKRRGDEPCSRRTTTDDENRVVVVEILEAGETTKLPGWLLLLGLFLCSDHRSTRRSSTCSAMKWCRRRERTRITASNKMTTVVSKKNDVCSLFLVVVTGVC